MGLNVLGNDSLEMQIYLNDQSLQQTIKAIESKIEHLTDTANKGSQSMEGIAKNAALAIGSYLSVSAGTDFLNKMVEVRGEFQKLEAVLTNSLGSNDLAKSALGMISDYAAKTPFQLTEIADAYVKLVNQGFKPTRDELTSLGDLAASTGKGFGQLAEAILDAQTNQFERLKEFGIKASKEGNNVKFTFKEVETTVKNTSVAIKDYLTGLGQLQGVSGSTAAISKTLVGQISNLRDSFDRMLNDLGQGSEGVLSSSIGAVSSLIENYQKVIDIIKFLTLTYGAYRTALIVNTVATSGLTAAETLHYAALVITEKAQKLLNLTMLSNPYGAIAFALGTLVAGYYAFGNEVLKVKSSVQLLNEAQNDITKNVSSQVAEVKTLVGTIQNQNVAESERLEAYKKLNQINPQILQGYDLQQAAVANLTGRIDDYIEAFTKRTRLEAYQGKFKESIEQEIKATDALAEANEKAARNRQRASDKLATPVSAASDAAGFAQQDAENTDEEVRKAFKNKEKAAQAVSDINKKIGQIYSAGSKEAIQAQIAALEATKSSFGKITPEYKKIEDQVVVLNEKLAKLQKVNTGGDGPVVKNKAFIDSEIKRLKELQDPLDVTSKKYIELGLQIKKLEDQLHPERGAKASESAATKQLHQENAAIEKQKSLLDELAKLHSEATQTGLTKEQTEIDKINEKYDLVLKKIEAFNKKYPNQKITENVIKTVRDDRDTEKSSATLKQQAEDFKKTLDEQEAIFTNYQHTVKQIGIDKANEMFAGQTKGFDTYLDYLQAQRDNLVNRQSFGDIGITKELEDVNKRIVDESKRVSKITYDDVIAAIKAVQTGADKKAKIEEDYQKNLIIIRERYKGEELTNKEAILKKSHDDELENLSSNLARQSKLYQKLNVDILRFSREQLKQRKQDLKDILNKGEYFDENKQALLPITPAMIADINSALGTTNNLLKDTKTTAGLTQDEFKKIIDYTAIAGSAFSTLGDAFAPLNKGLSDSLKKMSDITGIAGNVIKAISGDPLAAVAAVAGIIKIFAEAKQSRIAAQKDLEAFQLSQFTGELEINATYRERLRIQKDLNELKLDGLKKETDILNSQKGQVEDQYKKILALIQQQSFVSGTHTEKDRLFGLLLTGQTNTVKEFSGLAGKTYEDLEKLFLSGQLDEKAKALFQQLEKLKKEGIDIDAALEENKKKAAEIFTGTTSDSITDMIVDGFANGFKSVQDFANKTEDIIRKALLNALRYQALEEPIKKLYEQFAKDAESGGGLDFSEINSFNDGIKNAIETAQKMAEQLEKASGISLSAANAATSPNSLTGALKSLTEETGGIIAGNIGGLRLTSIEALGVARAQLNTLNKIENNTSLIKDLVDYNRKFDTQGIKLRA